MFQRILVPLDGTTQEFVEDRKSTRLNSSHQIISYAVFCLKKKTNTNKSRENGIKKMNSRPQKIPKSTNKIDVPITRQSQTLGRHCNKNRCYDTSTYTSHLD